MMRDKLAGAKNNHTPLYLQHANNLRDHIARGAIDQGGALRSERALSELMVMSHVTVRKGNDKLIEEGILFRKQGSGTFVATRIEVSGTVLSSFSPNARVRGEDPGKHLPQPSLYAAVVDWIIIRKRFR